MTDKSVPKIPGDLLEDILQAVSKDLTRGRQRIKNDWIRNARALWLCPNHHKVIHRFLSAPDIGETAMWRLLEGMTRAQAVILHELLMRSRKGLPS